MKSYTAVILAALAAAANAVQFTNVAINPEPGKPFELTWSGAEGPVTILLKSGSSDNLKTIDTIACKCRPVGLYCRHMPSVRTNATRS